MLLEAGAHCQEFFCVLVDVSFVSAGALVECGALCVACKVGRVLLCRALLRGWNQSGRLELVHLLCSRGIQWELLPTKR